MLLRKKNTFLTLKLKTKETLDFWTERCIFHNVGEVGFFGFGFQKWVNNYLKNYRLVPFYILFLWYFPLNTYLFIQSEHEYKVSLEQTNPVSAQ